MQDTGTGIIMGKRGQYVWTDGRDEEHLSRGVFRAYTETNLRYSQVGPRSQALAGPAETGLRARLLVLADKLSA